MLPEGFQECCWIAENTVSLSCEPTNRLVTYMQKILPSRVEAIQGDSKGTDTISRNLNHTLQVLGNLDDSINKIDIPIIEGYKPNQKRGKKPLQFRLCNLPSRDLYECIDFLEDRIDWYESHKSGKTNRKNKRAANKTLGSFDNERNSPKDTLEAVGQAIFSYVDNKCLKVRVLDMSKPVSLEEIYSEIYVNTRITGRQRKSISELLDYCRTNRNGADNQLLHNPRIKGVEAARKHSKVVVFGKAGAGKTTFLKWLSVQCCRGNIYPDCIPIFIRLRELVEGNQFISIEEHITGMLSSFEITDPDKVRKEFLQKGHLLLLLDGLDELNYQNTRTLISDIKRISNRYSSCPIFLTCRFGAINDVLQSFTDIEIGDLDTKQIQTFSGKWLSAQDCSDSVADFMASLEQNSSIKELATNPLMLTFFCLLYKEKKEFPKDRLKLYREGLSIWLERWDTSRGVERFKYSSILSNKQKHNLLSNIAFNMSNSKDVFYVQQDILNDMIEDHISSIFPDLKAAQDIEQTRKNILEYLESEIGLLIKAARNIYSFSHKTFQEYFTARFIAKSGENDYLELLSGNLVDENHWLEVLIFTGAMLDNANSLVQKITCRINASIEKDPTLKDFLTWSREKSSSIETPCAQAAINAFYVAGAEDIVRNRHLVLDLDLAIEFDKEFECSLMGNQNLVLDRILILLLDTAKLLSQVEDKYCEQDIGRIAQDCIMMLRPKNIFPLKSIDLERTSSIGCEEILDDSNTMQSIFDVVVSQALSSASNFEIKEALSSLIDEYEALSNALGSTHDWWISEGIDWTKKLRGILIEYRNIGHFWDFSDEQKASINYYLKGCKILIKCINHGFNIDSDVRESIELGLLNPEGFDLPFSCDL